MTYVVFDIYPHITVSLTNIVEYYENSNTNARTQVQNAIDNMVAKGSTRTIFVIAHRLSTIRNADMIVVLGSAEGTSTVRDGASVLEIGTHDELMKKEKGFYRALAMVTDSKNADDDESKVDDDSKINVAITPKGDGKTYDDETKQKGMQPLEIEVESKNADDDESEKKESFCSKLCGGGKDKEKDENEPYVLSRSII